MLPIQILGAIRLACQAAFVYKNGEEDLGVENMPQRQLCDLFSSISSAPQGVAFRDHLKARARDLLDARLHDILLSSWVSTGLINAVPHSNVMAHPESHPVRLVRNLFSADTLQLPDGSGSMNARPALLAASFVPKARLFALGEGQLVQLLQAVQKRTPQAYSLSESQKKWINTEFDVLL